MAKLIQDIEFGKNLQKIRKKRGLTQQDVCARLDLAGRPMVLSTYSQIETGARNIFISDLIAIKEILDVEYEDIFYGLEPVNKYDTMEYY